MAASFVEDRVQANLFMTPFRSPAISTITGGPCTEKSINSQCRRYREQCLYFALRIVLCSVLNLSLLAGSPEAQGKAELLMAVISSINKWQGYTVGASRVVSHVAGSLSKHRRIIHEVRPFPHTETRSLYCPVLR